MNYQSVIEAAYNRSAWQRLLYDVFSSRIEFFATPLPIDLQKHLAKQIYQLGKIKLADSEVIYVYEVQLQENVDIERNRVGIRNLLVSDWKSMGASGAIMLCYRSNESVLRFSYVSETWNFTEDGSYKKETTEPRRFTYYLGEGHRSRTAISQFEKLRDSKLRLVDLTKAFSVEAIGKLFFDEYKKHYEDIVQFVTGKRMVKSGGKWEEKQVGKPCLDIMTEFDQFENPEKAVRDYVKKLMGRLVFLQFLQKKGWLGVPLGKQWGEGDKEFVQTLFKECTDKTHFIDNVLEPLFNDINTRRPNDLASQAVGFNIRVPYLNGGLFELDEEDQTMFPLPKQYMESMLDFFSSYNFTIDENDPLDAEVGVDPEMLGRIFENLLEDNKDKGAYYTPKEIVYYMCRESLISYLQTAFNLETDREIIRQFVSTYDANLLTEEQKYQVDLMLKEVKICDPAIGSGAFPMGLLKELFNCRTALEGFDKEHASEIKKHIIQQNVYGVDIERGAVDIARLRFWLSLIVDEDTPHALPNMDFKIMQGNSLLESYEKVDLSGVAEEKQRIKKKEMGQGKLEFEEADIRRNIQLYIKQFYNVTDHAQKEELRSYINSSVRSYITHCTSGNVVVAEKVAKLPIPNSNFFLWHTYYYDVFDKGGFDIVIGNPPYGAKMTQAEKSIYKDNYVTTKTIAGVQKGSTDTYTLFIELGYNLLKKGGTLTYIVPISMTSSDSLTGVHRLLFNNCSDFRISSYAVRPQPVFENAVVNTSIFVCTKALRPCKQILSTKMYRKGRNFSLQDLIDNLSFVDVKDYMLTGRIPKIGTEIEKSILKKLFKQSKNIGDLIKRSGSPIIYRFAGGRYFKVITNYSNGSSAEKTIYFESNSLSNSIGCILSSNLSFWFYQIYSDNLNWKGYEIASFPIPQLSHQDKVFLNELYKKYLEDIEKNANVRISSGNSSYNVASFKEYKIGKSKTIIDEIDDYIAPLYGLTKQELEFIKNYEIEFRLSEEEA